MKILDSDNNFFFLSWACHKQGFSERLHLSKPRRRICGPLVIRSLWLARPDWLVESPRTWIQLVDVIWSAADITVLIEVSLPEKKEFLGQSHLDDRTDDPKSGSKLLYELSLPQ